MDKIQKVLIKAGRKDLAEEYYQKISSMPKELIEWKKEIERKHRPIKTISYKGFKIFVRKIESERFGDLYMATNNIGEDYIDVPAFQSINEAVNWDKKNVDQYVKENK